jgi:hypothetical protein
MRGVRAAFALSVLVGGGFLGQCGGFLRVGRLGRL